MMKQHDFWEAAVIDKLDKGRIANYIQEQHTVAPEAPPTIKEIAESLNLKKGRIRHLLLHLLEDAEKLIQANVEDARTVLVAYALDEHRDAHEVWKESVKQSEDGEEQGKPDYEAARMAAARRMEISRIMGLDKAPPAKKGGDVSVTVPVTFATAVQFTKGMDTGAATRRHDELSAPIRERGRGCLAIPDGVLLDPRPDLQSTDTEVSGESLS